MHLVYVPVVFLTGVFLAPRIRKIFYGGSAPAVASNVLAFVKKEVKKI